MSSQTEFLTVEDLLAAAPAALRGAEVSIRDHGLLDAAVARPRATVFGEDAYPGLDGKAAALLASLVGNHALVDGNKRLAWMGCVLFLAMNGVDLDAADDAAVDLVLAIADGRLVDVDKIAQTLRPWMRPLA